ncbi:hypothetical protein [Limnohabitans sp. DM1]|uniref:hypothetical protein n=1 Tax=Limnohabitans sp. DM1 TaxID=1597955 RepID=UPI000B112C8D|nr:hypothetical protein [Limnohabitans sp. DM1]
MSMKYEHARLGGEMKRVVSVVVIALASFATLSYAGVADDVEKAVKPYLPKKLDFMTTLLSVKAKGDELWYTYGVDVSTHSEAKKKIFAEGMKSLMVEELCKGQMSGLFPAGLRYLRAVYFAKDGTMLFGYAISKDDCKPQ